MLNFVFGVLALVNSGLVLEEIHNQDIFYNFIFYQDELYLGSNKGIYKIDQSGSRDMTLYDQTVVGRINPDLTLSRTFNPDFIERPVQLPEFYPNTITDIAYQGNRCYVITRGKLLIYHSPLYSFSPHRSVRSISNNGLGTYRGVYINGEKLNKISYTDGQIREFGDLTMVCYNGLLKYKDNEEVVIYDNDNSVLADAKYGHIRDIFSIGNSKYLLISTKGIYEYDEQSSVFDLLYACEKKIITIKNKIDDRIKDRGKFDFIDNGKYISLDVHAKGFDIVDNAVDEKIVDALECAIDGRFFYVITEDARFLKYIRSPDGLDLVTQMILDSPAHTIMDVEDIIFIAGNSGLSVYHRIKNQIARDIIIDEFNSSAVYKSSSEISFGGIHGVYTFNNLNQLDKELVFKDYEIDNNGSLLLGGVVSSLLLCIGFITFRFRKKTIVSDEQMISRIKRFINLNLPSVTLKMLELELDLDYNELNSLSKNFKPAKYIKERRGAIAKEMLLADELISEVSKKTGYSETYIVKNKYRFIK